MHPASTTRPSRRLRRPTLLAALLVALALTACTVPTPSGGPSGGSPVGGGDGPNVLRVLSGSELKDMAPILAEARTAIGVDVQLAEAGTLDASSDIATGKASAKYDASWLSSNRYLSLLPDGEKKIATSTKIMASPVLLGVRSDAAKRLGWDAHAPTWQQIAEAGASGKFRYAMTNPAASNSGFSTLVAVATSVTGGGAALNDEKAKQAAPQLKSFFTGQALTAGSTGWITDKFVADPSVDGLFSYENTLMETAKTMPGGLTIVVPTDGVITADYPLSLLASASDSKRALYEKLVDWLRTPPVQTKIMDATSRRPSAAGIKPDARFGSATLIDLPFPSSKAAVDTLLAGYLNVAKRPATTVYVLDTSGSMQGARLDSLKSAMGALTTTGGTGAFTGFHAREDITLLPFSSAPADPTQFTVPEQSPDATLRQIKGKVDGLAAGGNTALYESLERAVQIVNQRKAANASSYPTVVALTDGEANGTLAYGDFESFFKALPVDQKVPVFTIRFGDAKASELEKIATLTGGRSFDGSSDLSEAFRTIRGYQ